MRVVAVALLLVAFGCSFDEVELSGKACPCASGWVCDPATLLCVPLLPADGGLDATRADAAAIDAPTSDRAMPPTDAPGLDAGPDAGPRDSGFDGGPIDAGLDAGPPDPTGCDDLHAGALLCDGFESDADFAEWTENRGASETMTPVYRGDWAMRATSSTSDNTNYVFERFTDVTSGELFVRTYVYLPSGSPAEHLVLAQLEEGGAPWDYAHVALRSGALRVGHRKGSTYVYRDGPPMPRDRWVCLELRVEVASAGTVQMFVDGASAASFSADTNLSRPYSTFYIGISYRGSSQTGTANVYMDEIVLSRSRIGCDP